MNIMAAIATIIAFLIVIAVSYRRDMLKSTFFPFLLFAVLFYQLGNLIEIVSTTVDVANVGFKIRFIGVPFIPTLWYLCVLEFCGIEFKKKYTLPFLFVVPLLICFLVGTWEWNHLLFSDVIYSEGSYWGNPKIIPGPLFYWRQLYQYSINILGIVTLVSQYRKGNRRFRKQIFLFLVSALIPFFNTSTYIVAIGRYNIDITPYGLLVSVILLSYFLYQMGVINRANIIKENALDQVNEGVILFDLDGIYMDCNNAAQLIFPELKKVPMCTGIADMAYLPFNSSTLDGEQKKSSIQEFTKENEGTLKKTFGVSIAPIHFHRKPIGYGVILNNISLMKKALGDLEEKSIKDPLTKLYNRGYLFTVAENWLESARLNSEPFGVVMFDIDHFKKVNDTHGHVYGDFVLREMAEICSLGLRQSDILGRYGGEEFCLLLLNTPAEGAYVKAESLRAKIASHRFVQDGVQISITSSFGVASYDRELENDTFTEILKRADTNLYKAKHEGRNKVC